MKSKGPVIRLQKVDTFTWFHLVVAFHKLILKTITGLDKQKIIRVKFKIFFYPYILAYVLGAQKNRLIETVLLSTHNICFV